MLLLNFSPCFGFCSEKSGEKVLFVRGLPFFWVRIACLNGMCKSVLCYFGIHSVGKNEMEVVEKESVHYEIACGQRLRAHAKVCRSCS